MMIPRYVKRLLGAALVIGAFFVGAYTPAHWLVVYSMSWLGALSWCLGRADADPGR